MFEKVLLDEKKYSRKKPIAVAIVFEISIIVFLVFAPLLFKTDGSAELILIEQVFLPLEPQAGLSKSDESKSTPSPKNHKRGPEPAEPIQKEILQSPTEIPLEVIIENDVGNKSELKEEGKEEGERNTSGVPDGKPCNTPECVPGGTSDSTKKEEEPEPEAEPPPPEPSPRVGGDVKQAKLIHKVEPVYPPLAKQNRIQGNVVLEGIIGLNGKIHNIKVVSGHPLLTQSAIDAVKQWIYEPATLNNEPIEVKTTITVKFVLKN